MNEPHRRIILTGASTGIGRALAVEYGRRGARLLLIARRADLLRETAHAVEEAGGKASILVADVTGPEVAEQALAQMRREHGGLDAIVMNAGVGFPSFAQELDAEQAERVMAVNYLSAVRMVEATLPGMLAENRGQLVAVSSLAAYRGMPGSAIYNASKAALTVFMESLRTELRTSGVTITTIAPGFVRTPMTDQNEFRMPFLMEPDAAARRVVRAIERGRGFYAFPLPTALAVRFSQLLPNAIYDRIIAWGRSISSPETPRGGR